MKDTEKIQQRLIQIEDWSKEQGSLFNTVIDSINENVLDLRYVTEFVNRLSEKVVKTNKDAERKVRFLNLTNGANKHISLHRERIHALLNAHKGILTPALISPKQLKAIINWTMQKHFHQPLVHDTLLYYNLAAVHVIEHFVKALIPFNGELHYQLYTLRPFPIMANSTAVI